jgi:hypothetical protein
MVQHSVAVRSLQSSSKAGIRVSLFPIIAFWCWTASMRSGIWKRIPVHVHIFRLGVALSVSANHVSVCAAHFRHWHSNQIRNLIELRLRHFVAVRHWNRFVFLPLLLFSRNHVSLSVSCLQHWTSNQILNLIELRGRHFLDVHHSNRFVFLHLLPFFVNLLNLQSKQLIKMLSGYEIATLPQMSLELSDDQASLTHGAKSIRRSWWSSIAIWQEVSENGRWTKRE